MEIRNPFASFKKSELILWLGSALAVTASFAFGGKIDPLTLIATLTGVTALIFIARGDALGQILTVIFSLIYGVISLRLRYYGEMITYVGMTAPIAALSAISWIRHPHKSGAREVAAAELNRRQTALMLLLTALVTAIFYFILKYFDTANLTVSTISIATSFLASYLMLFRSPCYALAYAANDVVLIILWVLAAMEDANYFPMVVCFVVFFLNDVYGFYSWRNMKARQDMEMEKDALYLDC